MKTSPITLALGVLGTTRATASVLAVSPPSQREFLVRLLPATIDLMGEKNIPVSASTAMAIYESNYGRSQLARVYNNYFGIKAFNDWSGLRARNMPTRDSAVLTRAYASLSESARNYGQFLTTKKHYRPALDAAPAPAEHTMPVFRASSAPSGPASSVPPTPVP
jgi:flagellum-specific peptidoglycan hydrolase FlgJ